MSHGLPLDWYEEHQGQGLVLDSGIVAEKISDLNRKLAAATKYIDEGTNAMGRLMEAETALRRIKSLDEKNVSKYAQQIASETLLKIQDSKPS